MKFLLRSLMGFVVIVVIAALGVGFYLAYKVGTHENVHSQSHFDAKQAYLKQLTDLPALDADAAPNVVVILFDDMGFGDIGAYGNRLIDTPHMDRLAQQGLMLTQGFSGAPYCTPSRAALLTGRYAGRMQLTQVIFPATSPIDKIMRLQGAGTQLPQDEVTLAEILQARGYATQMIGKWHLGEGPGAEPNDFGFADYYGVLFSNDMAPLDLYRNREIVDPAPIDQTTLTARYTDEAVKFIEGQSDAPLFLYFAHTFPHVPLYADPARAKQSGGGLYGDVIEDLDRSVGAVMAALERAGKLDNTLVIVTSDNGPWYQGSTGQSRGRKNETFDGGMRVPFILYWKDRIAAAQSDSLVSSVDIVPTILALTGTPAPQDRMLDGVDASAVLQDPAANVREALMLERAGRLEAIRTRTHKYRGDFPIYGGNTLSSGLAMAPPRGPMLFNIAQDPHEAYDVTDAQPETAAQLRAALEAARQDWTSNRRGWIED